MDYQTVFKRYELKYFLTVEQLSQLLEIMKAYMALDSYGHTVIRNIYFDTDTYRLVRHSLEGPIYKEKLRVRSYLRTTKDSTVFVELKKKYDSVVYKRRLAMKEQDAFDWLCSGKSGYNSGCNNSCGSGYDSSYDSNCDSGYASSCDSNYDSNCGSGYASSCGSGSGHTGKQNLSGHSNGHSCDVGASADRCPVHSQIAREIDYFRSFYGTLHPAMFISYERDAYYSLNGGDFRVTFDSNIISRESELTLESDVWGTRLLCPGQVLMEIKTPGGIPLWMTHFLTRNHIYKTSFSKYGAAYCRKLAKSQATAPIMVGSQHAATV